MKPEGITLKLVQEQDQALLFEIYASTREQEMAMAPWSEQQKQEFLEMQFNAQHSFYREQFSDANFDIIKQGGTPIGRLYLDRREDEFRIIDIALLSAFRGRGLGGEVLKSILNEAEQALLPVRIHVEKNNPAMRLYKRLGFKPIEDKGVYDLLEWLPA